jgi:putative addiction module component (TIGR02574 family)
MEVWYTRVVGAAPKLPPAGFDELSTEEQVDYINDLWGRVLAHPESVPVPDWHREILAERLAEYRSGNAGAGRAWSEVQRDLRAELDKVRR